MSLRRANESKTTGEGPRSVDLLIQGCALSENAVAHIQATQDESNISFFEAALQLGYARQEDLVAATKWADKISLIKQKLDIGEELQRACESESHIETLCSLRTELMFQHSASEGANVISVVSPRPREGRSFLSAGLAISFAQLGQSTLLVDADLRKPRMHSLFGADNVRGLGQALALDEKPQIHQVDQIPQLFVLTSGSRVDNPLELLAHQRCEKLLDEWRHSYRHVIIDTAPFINFADALTVATLARRVLVMSRAAHTSMKDTKEMLRRLNSTRATVLGAVINRF